MKNTAEALSGALGIYQSVLEPYKLPDTIESAINQPAATSIS